MANTPHPTLKVKLIHEKAIIPSRQTEGAAGYDLYAVEDCIIKSHDRRRISTGIEIQLPPGTYGRIASRSSLALGYFLDTKAGVIDSDYRGEVKVLLANDNIRDYTVHAGERVAQLIIERILTPEVEVVDELDDTPRNDGGFGSTGK